MIPCSKPFPGVGAAAGTDARIGIPHATESETERSPGAGGRAGAHDMVGMQAAAPEMWLGQRRMAMLVGARAQTLLHRFALRYDLSSSVSSNQLKVGDSELPHTIDELEIFLDFEETQFIRVPIPHGLINSLAAKVYQVVVRWEPDDAVVGLAVVLVREFRVERCPALGDLRFVDDAAEARQFGSHALDCSRTTAVILPCFVYVCCIEGLKAHDARVGAWLQCRVEPVCC